MQRSETSVEVEGGGVPVVVQGGAGDGGADAAAERPALVVVPSIFGPAPDLLDQMASLADIALTVVLDPFWRVGAGVIPYEDHPAAFDRLKGFDLETCFREITAVIEWTRARCNGRVAGLGICFGGFVVLELAGRGELDGIITWHGSRMEAFLDKAGQVRGSVRMHYGSADPITPKESIDKVRAAFANHPDTEIVVHPGLDHGFSHAGASYDEAAARAGLDAAREVLVGLRQR